jgi:hypothetical protein
VPDDPIARKLDTQLDSLGKLLGKVDRQLGRLDESARETAKTQKEIQRQLDALGQLAVITQRVPLRSPAARAVTGSVQSGQPSALAWQPAGGLLLLAEAVGDPTEGLRGGIRCEVVDGHRHAVAG